MVYLNKSTLTYPATNVFPNGIWEDVRDPTSSDFRSFAVGVIWINFMANRGWLMVHKTATSGTWIQMASTGTGILTMTGNSGGAVGPDGSNNLNLIGAGTLSVTGSSSTHTLTIAQDGTVATSYAEDSGSAVPSGGVLNIVGGTGVHTTGAGSTVTINAMASVPLHFTTSSGTANPAANNVNVFQSSGITTTGAGSTITIGIDTSVVGETITGNSGGALSPTAGNWNIVGGTGASTSGSGSTLTINVTGGGISWQEITVAGPTSMVVNNGYLANNAVSVVNLLLPSTAAQFSIIRVVGKGAAGWKITQNAGQTIIFEGSTTTSGGAGFLQSTGVTDAVELLCTTTNTTWTIMGGTGNYIFN